jgi:signal transduction histidine kinase
MAASILANGPFYWLRAPRNNDGIRLDEWIIAIARLLLSICYLAVLISPHSSASLKIFVSFYLLYSLLIILLLRTYSLLSPLVHVGIHCADILWAIPMIIVGHRPEMSFVIFFFVIAGSAFRWGFLETLLTAAIFCVTLPLGFGIFDSSMVQLYHRASISELVAPALVFVAIVCFIGLLAEVKAARSEETFLARVLEGIRVGAGLEEVIGIICKYALQLYGSTQVLFVMHDRKRNQCQLYRLARSQEALQHNMLDSSQQKQYFFPAPANWWRLAIGHPHSKNRFTCHTLRADKIKKEKTRCGLPDTFLTQHPFSLMLAVSHAYESGWAVRFYMLNPNRYVGGVAGLRFSERSVHLIAPVLYDAFQVDRLTTEAKTAATSSVARELHDGVIQSLSSILMQLEEVRTQAAPMAAKAVDRIARIQESIREEITGLRDLTLQLRSLEVEPGRLLSFLSGMTLKFQCEHGITTRFISEIEEVPLQPRVCVELARIVQEALVNIRKHSGADKATVCWDRRDGYWLLRVTDNGRGFDFSGRRSHKQLQDSGKGPIILMERARSINGRVSIESKEGEGTCLEVTFPQDLSENQAG